MPSEWQPHTRCWMVWPMEHQQWVDFEAVEKNYASIANAIREFEPVTMVVDPVNAVSARKQCGANIKILELPNDDSWARDIAPTFLKHKDTGEIAGVDWRFNCWGGYYPGSRDDAQMASRILNHLDIPAYHSSLTLEGGAIHVDGEGTLITTESCALNPNRNWGEDKASVEEELRRATGCKNIIWLPGDPDSITGDMTDGHVDGILCFIKPGVVLIESDADKDNEFSKLDRENRRALELATDANGKKFEIIDLEVDHSCIGLDEESEHFCASYVNFYIANGGIVMPKYGVPADDQAAELLASLFPERKVAMVDIRSIAPGGGGIHCITQQQPA